MTVFVGSGGAVAKTVLGEALSFSHEMSLPYIVRCPSVSGVSRYILAPRRLPSVRECWAMRQA